jgi:hypothetical protein
MEKKLLLYFGGNNPKPKELGLPVWIPTTKMAFIQSVNRINNTVGDFVNPFKSFIATETIEELRLLPYNNISFEDQAHKTAIEIKNKTKDSKVFLMYSGGIDSTAALVAIMNTWGKEDLERVYILMSYKSIEEFPSMWKTINKIFKGRILNSLLDTNAFLSEGYMITGEMGDQLLGSDILIPLVDLYGDAGINMPWKDNINYFYKRFFLKDFRPYVDLFVDMHSQTLPYCPFEIKTCAQFLWWFNFTNKWQLVKYRMLEQKRFTNKRKSFEKLIHFYDTPTFQKWSMDTPDLKIQNNLLSYKFCAKEFIVKYTKYKEYLNKPKVGSLQFIWSNFDKCYAFDQNFNEMTIEETAECINHE